MSDGIAIRSTTTDCNIEKSRLANLVKKERENEMHNVSFFAAN